MARRASSKLHPLWFLAVLLLLGVAVLGGLFLLRQVNDPYRTIPPLESAAYLENANSLRGNVYKVEGTILNSLAWSPLHGRMFSLEVPSGTGSDILPVLIPPQFNHVNIQKGQQFRFQIEVGEKGILTARDLSKV